MTDEKVCAHTECGRVFTRRAGTEARGQWAARLCCSVTCARRHRLVVSPPQDKQCLMCPTMFRRNPSQESPGHWERRKFCSPGCASASRRTGRAPRKPSTGPRSTRKPKPTPTPVGVVSEMPAARRWLAAPGFTPDPPVIPAWIPPIRTVQGGPVIPGYPTGVAS